MATFIVSVKRSPFSGIGADGARLNLLPGQYQVREDGPFLVFEGADSRNGGSLMVNMRDYPEIGIFPDAIHPNTQIELVR